MDYMVIIPGIPLLELGNLKNKDIVFKIYKFFRNISKITG